MFIAGNPGTGKTWQLRRCLEDFDVAVVSVDAVDLKSKKAGEPAKFVREKYLKAGQLAAKRHPAALVIDDIDTALGEWEGYTGTASHQDILAFFIHIAELGGRFPDEVPGRFDGISPEIDFNMAALVEEACRLGKSIRSCITINRKVVVDDDQYRSLLSQLGYGGTMPPWKGDSQITHTSTVVMLDELRVTTRVA